MQFGADAVGAWVRPRRSPNILFPVHALSSVFRSKFVQAQNDAVNAGVLTNARFAENKHIYDSSVREMIQIAFDEVPRVPLFQPSQDVAMQKDVMGYQYWFLLQPDYRQLYKA